MLKHILYLFFLLNFSNSLQVPISKITQRQFFRARSPFCVVVRLSSTPTDKDTKDNSDIKQSSLSFDEAEVKLKDEDELRRLENQGSGLSEEELGEHIESAGQMDSMRDRIRKSAQNLGVEKSVATQEAIREATLRAMNKESTPTLLDVTAFDSKVTAEDEMTEDEKKIIEEMKATPWIEVVKEEFAKVKFPGFMSVIRLVVVMFLLFWGSANGIWNLEALIRAKYEDWGLIPPPISDFSVFYNRDVDYDYEAKFGELPWWKAPEWYEDKVGKKPFLGSEAEKWGTYTKESETKKLPTINENIPQEISE